MRTALVSVVALAALVAASTPGSSSAVEPRPPAQKVKRLVIPAAKASLPATWKEAFFVPYGAGPTKLGTSPGGDSGSLDIGPEYGAAAPDGSWWFLDYAKGRLAHYDAEGAYLGKRKIPKRLLVGGIYYQWQLPHILANGLLVATRQTGTNAYLLRVKGKKIDEVKVKGSFVPTYDDGVSLFGFIDGEQVRVNPRTGAVKRARSFPTPSGTPFTLKVAGGPAKLRIGLPDRGILKSLPTRTASGAKAHIGLQVRAGADDRIHLFMTGIGEDDESVQLVGYTSVSRSGRVAAVEGLPNPFSDSDPGSPAQLTIAPGSSTPMLIYVLEDGVHVYERTP